MTTMRDGDEVEAAMAAGAASPTSFEFLYRPGAFLPDHRLREIGGRVREAASACGLALPALDVPPSPRGGLRDQVLALARGRDGAVEGFACAWVVDVDGVGEVLDLGPAGARPDPQRCGCGEDLEGELRRYLLRTFLLRRKPLGRVWCTEPETDGGQPGAAADTDPGARWCRDPGLLERWIRAAVSDRRRLLERGPDTPLRIGYVDALTVVAGEARCRWRDALGWERWPATVPLAGEGTGGDAPVGDGPAVARVAVDEVAVDEVVAAGVAVEEVAIDAIGVGTLAPAVLEVASPVPVEH